MLRVTHLPGIDWLELHEMDPALYTETKPENTHISGEKLTEVNCTKVNKRNGTKGNYESFEIKRFRIF